MKSPKVLLCSPININKEYCLYDWLKAIQNLTYPDIDIFLVDNSATPAFSEKIKELGFNCVYENPGNREAREYIAASRERCRIKFLSGDYDYFFSLECDVFPQPDVVEKLLKHNLDVVGCTYFTEKGYHSHLQLQTIYKFHDDFKTHNREYKIRFLTFEESQLFMNGKVKPVYGAGIGCVLIKRNVLEDIKFRIEKDKVGFDDSFFHNDLWICQIDFNIDTSMIPEHRNSSWNTVLSDTLHKKIQAAKGDIKL